MILAAKVCSMNKWHPELIQKSKYKYLFWSIFVSDDAAIGLAFDLYKQKILKSCLLPVLIVGLLSYLLSP